jgi:hypothetical protein
LKKELIVNQNKIDAKAIVDTNVEGAREAYRQDKEKKEKVVKPAEPRKTEIVSNESNIKVNPTKVETEKVKPAPPVEKKKPDNDSRPTTIVPKVDLAKIREESKQIVISEESE